MLKKFNRCTKEKMAHKSFTIVSLLSILINCLQLAYGQQVYLSLGSTTITNNNTEIIITDIGEDALNGLPSLMCHTDLTTCCRSSDGVAAGDWYHPDGTVVPRPADAVLSDPFYRTRNVQVARLNRRSSNNPLSPTGSYCCVMPTSGGEMTFCANIVVCPSLALTNGMISYSDPTLGVDAVAIHSCNAGYIHGGSYTRTCGSNGQWSGSAGFCGVLCPSLPSLINGVISYSQQEYTSGVYLQNTRATYSCNQGYILIGESSSTCQSNRTWSPPIPSCRALCPSLPRLSNGVTSYSQELRSGSYIEDTVVMYTCNQGYTLIGESSGVCQSDRTWSSSQAVCRALCPSLPTLANGRITYSQEEQDGVYIEDTVAMYSCNKDYTLIGDNSSTCQPDRTWSPSVPYCRDDAIIQLKFGPTSHCIQWSEQKVAAVRESLRQAIHEVITSGSEAIPLVNIEAGVFSCRMSQTTTTYRTTILGTVDASAVKAAADIQRRVESGFVVMVEWYLVDVISSCPVHIDSLLQDECIEDQCVEGCVAVCKARG